MVDLKRPVIAAALLAMTTPAYAAYFGCTVTKTQQTVTRPNGDTGSQWTIVKKGDELRIEGQIRQLAVR